MVSKYTANRRNQRKHSGRICDHKGCDEEGIYKAPKSRGSLKEYYHFCLKHVQDYNKNWNYYEGMDSDQVDEENKSDIYWRKPTRPFGIKGSKDFFNSANDPLGIFHEYFKNSSSKRQNSVGENFSPNSKIGKALRVMEIKSIPSEKDLKVQYKKLVKMYHPDKHGGDKIKEEHFKKISISYNHILDYMNDN